MIGLTLSDGGSITAARGETSAIRPVALGRHNPLELMTLWLERSSWHGKQNSRLSPLFVFVTRSRARGHPFFSALVVVLLLASALTSVMSVQWQSFSTERQSLLLQSNPQEERVDARGKEKQQAMPIEEEKGEQAKGACPIWWEKQRGNPFQTGPHSLFSRIWNILPQNDQAFWVYRLIFWLISIMMICINCS